MILQAITTKFFGPGNRLGSRVKASAQAGSVTLHWDHALNPDCNHARAAMALAAKLKWDGKYFGGGMPGGNGNCYVNAGQQSDEPEFEVRGAMLYLRGLRQEG